MENIKKVWLEKHTEKRAERFNWSEVPALFVVGGLLGWLMYVWLV